MALIHRIETRTPRQADGECWISTYALNHNGYCHVSGGRRLHRIAWEAHNAEPIPPGMVVMHTCDNRACFNPEHLVLGTQRENIHDCIAKGRRATNRGGGRPHGSLNKPK